MALLGLRVLSMLLLRTVAFMRGTAVLANAQLEGTCRHDHAMLQVELAARATWARFSDLDCVKQTKASDAQCIPCKKNLSDGTLVDRFQGNCKRDATVLASQVFTPWHTCGQDGSCPWHRLPKFRGGECWAFNKGEFTRYHGPAGVCIKKSWPSRHIPTVDYAKANMAHSWQNVADFIAAYQWSMEQRESWGDRPDTVMTCQLFCGEGNRSCGNTGDCTCGEACAEPTPVTTAGNQATLATTTTTTTTTMTTTTSTTTAMASTMSVIGPVHDGDTIWLRAHTGRFLTVQGTGLHAKWRARLSWEALVIEKASSESAAITSGDAIFLRAHTGNRVTVGDFDEGGHFEATAVHAKWNHKGSWQRFIIEKKGTGGPIYANDTIYLRAHTGKRIAVEGTLVQAKWDHMGSWQALVLESDDASLRAA
mmetsp:Transcript_66174/g.171694  ORF Transcript_66174/g.171694 Transcript_66174/m.171694 type:complete len:422 (+) Transcript_66174:61-1326(+)